MNHLIHYLPYTAGMILTLSSCNNKKETSPNIIIILADDMGYSDLGCYGSEIHTPNLDKMAYDGVRFSQFYNTGRSCPSRASLLTGMYSHKTGIGHMTKDHQLPGYRGELNDSCMTIAQLVAGAGYSSYASGKWHVGEEYHNLPMQRGFQRFFGSDGANGNYFGIREGRKMFSGNNPIEPPGEWLGVGEAKYKSFTRNDGKVWYSTEVFTDSMMAFISDHVSHKPEQPFFAYLAYTAPHWPLQALATDIKKYDGMYDKGWDKTRAARYEKLKQLGIITEKDSLTLRDKTVPSWDSINDQAYQADLMEIYAAMIDNLDQQVGRIFHLLDSLGIDENTLVMFLSDNGGCAEHVVQGDTNAPLGSAASFLAYETQWANVSNTPFRLYKKWNHEGGISSPLIIRYPRGNFTKGSIIRQPVHIVDIFASIQELAHAAYPNNEAYKEVDGISLLPLLRKEDYTPHEYLFWEHEGNKAVRKGDWKLVMENGGNWELYNMKNDRAESRNLISQNPELAKELENKWKEWAAKCHVEDFDFYWKK